MQCKLIFCITRGESYPNINTIQKNLMSNSIEPAANCKAEMTCHMFKRSRATTSHHLQTSCHPLPTTTGVQNVVTQHIGKGSHAQQKSNSARYVTNLATLRVNVSKRNNILNRNIDNRRHIRYKSMSHFLIYIITYQTVALRKTHSVCKSKYINNTGRSNNLLPLLI